jgi:hypothetical protein
LSEFESSKESKFDREREMMANAFVRELDQIAVREGCDLPVTMLVAIVRLFGEHLESRLGPTARIEARHEFTRCGAINDTAPPATFRCVRRRDHAGEHFAAGGERWGDDAGAAEYVRVSRPIRLLCFSGCGAVATHGRFCCDHRPLISS